MPLVPLVAPAYLVAEAARLVAVGQMKMVVRQEFGVHMLLAAERQAVYMTLTVLPVILEAMDVAMVVAEAEAMAVSILGTEARVAHLVAEGEAVEMVLGHQQAVKAVMAA